MAPHSLSVLAVATLAVLAGCSSLAAGPATPAGETDGATTAVRTDTATATTPTATTASTATPTATPTPTATTTSTATPTPTSATSDPADPDDPGETSHDTGTEVVTSGRVEALVHQRINEIRTREGLATLDYDPTVASVARAHSEDMHARDYFDHVNPDGESPWDRYGDVAGETCTAYGENVAYNWLGRDVQTGDGTERYDTNEEIAAAVVEQWMGSSGHRQNVLSDRWTSEGVGVYVADDGKVFVTQNFCG